MRQFRFAMSLLLLLAQMDVLAINLNETYDFASDGMRFKITDYQERVVELVSLTSASPATDYLNIPNTVQYESLTFTVNSLGVRCCSSSTLKSVNIPSTITTIKEGAFEKCTSLASVSFQEGVTDIGEGVFQGCKSLASITLPKTVRSLGSRCFSASALLSFACPDSLRGIDGWCFSDCKSLTNVIFNDSLKYISGMAFYDCPLSELNLPQKLQSIGTNAFENGRFKTVTIPERVAVICGFQNCTELEEMILPDSVVEITNLAGCTKLRELDIRHCSFLRRIPSYSFSHCGLKKLEFPDTVYCWTCNTTKMGVPIPGTERKVESSITLEWRSFVELDLDTLVLSHAVSSISRAFEESTIKHVFVKQEKPMSVSEESTFNGKTYLSGVLHVPTGTRDAYANASVWQNFVNIIDDIVLDSPVAAFTLTYIVDDKVYRSYRMEAGEAITPEPLPVKEGYDFSGWSEIPATMPEHDVVVRGYFTKHPTEQCSTPTIVFVQNKITLECDTPGAEFQSVITTEEVFTGSELDLSNRDFKYTLTVYATAPGYLRSEPAKFSVVINSNDVNKDGIVDVADIAKVIDAMRSQNQGQMVVE